MLMGILLAVNLGNDADTTGAIYGQLAGAFYGAEKIPEEWRGKLRGRIYSFMTRTLNLSLLNLRSRNSSQMQKSKSSILNRKRRRKYSTVLREQPRNVAG